MSGDIWKVTAGTLVASSGQRSSDVVKRPMMHRTVTVPTENDLVQMSTVLSLRNPALAVNKGGSRPGRLGDEQYF